MELYEIKHNLLNKEIDYIKSNVDEHEDRITLLEKINYARDEQIKNILEGMDRTNKSIDSLVSWIKWGLAFVVPAFIGFFTWLLQNQIVWR